MNDYGNFFVFQRRALAPLLRWGIGSSLLGAGLLLVPRPFWRQFGLQAVSWGVIDVLLAMFGRRQALVRAEQLAAGTLEESDIEREAATFERILLVNAGLDVGYIAAGGLTAAVFADHPDRRGIGVGILVQGLFLLLFDALLARDVRQRFLDTTHG
jgi:hypothetical protein